MLARKQSITGGDVSTAALIADYGPDETQSESNDDIWPNRSTPRNILRLLALCSLISVMLNTPKTFDHAPYLIYVTFFIDLLCVVVFTAEMIAKMKDRGLYAGEKAYIRWEMDISYSVRVFYAIWIILFQGSLVSIRCNNAFFHIDLSITTGKI